ncbi:HEAT repeat-containing protein 1 [Hyalella azteca]|uniref:HEAT repeat-containing protein 1 n=1 Tax=Hyalella azteca TaxID=294128 RepID=A0A8B7PEB6_HYAAZ|nr:HEAT repeat-containing protein 1 [Hyalella azteca]
MSSLQQQLECLAAPQTNIYQDKRLKPSLLYDDHALSDTFSLDHFHDVGISGFNDLVKLNGKFGKYKHLFSEESKHVQRFVADSDTNKVLDEAIEGFLLLLSPYFLTLTPALKAMEWLLQRYAIHEMNVDAVMMCILPYYESPLFLRTVKVLNLKQVGSSGEQNRWNWLLRAQQSGMLLVKSIMYDQWVHNPAFRLFCNKYIKKVIKVHDRDCDAQHAINFFTTTVVGGVARMADLGKNTGKSLATEEHVMRVLQGMHVWVKCSFNELVCGSYLITMQLSMSVQLNTNLWDQIIALLLKYQKEELQAQLCVCLVTVYNHQYMTRMGPAVLELLQESSVLQKLADKPDNTRVTSFLLAYAGGYVKSCLEEYSGAEKELQQHLLSLAIYLSQFRLSAAQAAAVIRNIMEAASEYGQSMPEKELKSCLSSLLEHFEKSWPEGYDKALSFFQAQAASASATEHSKVLTMMNSVSQKQLTESLSVDEVSAVEVASAVSSVQSILVSLKKLNSACVRNVDAQLTRDLADSLTDQCIQAVRTYKVERHPVKTAPKHEKVWLQLAETGVVAWDLLSAVAEACLLVVSALTPSTNYCFPTHTKQCQGDSFTLLLSLKLVYLLHFKRRKAQVLLKKLFKRVGDDSCVLRLLSSIWGLQPHMPHCDLATPDVKVLCMESALSLLQDESGKEATKTLSLLAMQQREFIVPSIISALSFCDDDSDVQRSVRCAAAQLVSTIHTNVTSSSSAKGYAPLISALHKHTKAVFMDTSSQYLVSTMSSVCREDPALLQLVLSAVTSSSQPPHLAGVLLFTLAQLEHKSIIGKLLPIIERLVRKGSAEGGQTSSDAAVDSQFTLDPSESMLLYWSLVHLNSESVKVLDTDKGWQVISAAFNVNKTIINLEGQLLSPQAVIAQQVISHKLLRHLNSSKALGKLWSLMAAAASDIGTSQRKVSRLHQALKSVSLHAKFVLEQIQQLNLITATTSIKDAQAKRMKIDQEKSLRKARRSVGDSKETPKSDDGEDVAPTSLPGNWRHLYLLLELLCEVEGVSEPWLLVDMLCTCLNEGLAFGLQLAEPVVQQLLASLHHLIQLTLTHPPKNTSLSSVVPVNVEAVVQCIRQSSDPYTHRQAFLVLAVAANIHPDAVLHNLMTIFTFMGEGLLQRDDHFSYQVIETTVNTLVPILVQRSRNSCAVGDVVQVFVDALPDISVHRRLMIFKLLTVALQPHTHLWLVLSLTIKSYALSGHSRLAEDTSTRSSSRSDLNSSYASSGGASDAMLGRKRAGELNFILRLCEEFAVRDQVIAVQQILALLTALPTDIGTSYKKNWSMNHQFISVLKLNALSGKQLRNFIYTTVGFLNQLFTSETFLATLLPVSESSEEKEQEKLQQSYCQLLTTVTAYLDTTTNLISHTQRTDTLSYKFWSALQRKIVEFHESVCAVLQSRQLLSVASLLVRSPLPAVKLRSLELLRTRLLPSAAFFTENDTEALLLLLPELLSLGCCDTESQDTKQVSLSVLHLLLRFLGTSLKPEEVLPVLHTAVLQIPKQENTGLVVMQAILVVAECIGHVSNESIAVLPRLMPTLLTLLVAPSSESDHLPHSAATALYKVIENTPKFLTRYLQELLVRLCRLSWLLSAKESTKDLKIHAKLSALATVVKNKIEPQVLLPNLLNAYDELSSGPSHEVCSVIGVLELVKDLVKRFDQSALRTHQSQLLALLERALGSRQNLKDLHDANDVAAIEDAAINAITQVVMGQDEASNLSLLNRFVAWADEQNTMRCRISLYRLVQHLGSTLQVLFIKARLADQIFDHAVESLALTVLENKSASRDEAGASELLAYVLASLTEIFRHDTAGFTTDTRFKLLMDPIVLQMKNTIGGLEAYKERIQNQLRSCLLSFCGAARNDALWSDLSKKMLLLLREDLHPEVNAGVLALVQSLVEEFREMWLQPMLTDTLPYVTEALESHHAPVEEAARKLLAFMEDIMGDAVREQLEV